MPKRNVLFTKPDEPAFLKRMKNDIGYKESVNVQTKFETVPDNLPDDRSDDDEETPQVIVLKPGDLTKDEADKQKAKITKDEEEKPADLNQRIIFKSQKNGDKPKKSSRKMEKPVKNVLSFVDYDEDDD